MEKLRKIHIVGPAGSGKTTLADYLCQHFNYPHFDLDEIRYPKQTPRPIPEAKKMLTEAVKKDKWVIEGVYVSWIGQSLQKADQIIWLDLPFSLTAYRITKRFIKNQLTGQDLHGFKAFLRLFRQLIHHYYPHPEYEKGQEEGEYSTRLKTQIALEPFKKKVIQIKNSDQLNDLRKKIFT